MLLTYRWPGNVRELDNLLQRALILTSGPVIEPEHIRYELMVGSEPSGAPAPSAPPAPAPPPTLAPPAAPVTDAARERSSSGLSDSLREAERALILNALHETAGDRRSVAERLGISPRTLRYKLARLREAGIEVPAP
jgi:two-component system response regulator FlrC